MAEYKRSIEEQIQNLPSIIDLKHQIRALKQLERFSEIKKRKDGQRR